MSGLIAGISLANKLNNKEVPKFNNKTMVGAITSYLTTENQNFQPMNANFGILAPLEENIKDKQQRKLAYYTRAMGEFLKLGEI